MPGPHRQPAVRLVWAQAVQCMCAATQLLCSTCMPISGHRRLVSSAGSCLSCTCHRLLTFCVGTCTSVKLPCPPMRPLAMPRRRLPASLISEQHCSIWTASVAHHHSGSSKAMAPRLCLPALIIALTQDRGECARMQCACALPHSPPPRPSPLPPPHAPPSQCILTRKGNCRAG